MTDKLSPLRIGDTAWGADVEPSRLAAKVNDLISAANQRHDQMVKRIAKLEEQVRLMAQIVEKLTTLHPEAQPAPETPCVTLKPGDVLEIENNSGRVTQYRSSLDDFYASREAKMAKEDLIEQRRRNFPLDPPSSAVDDDGLGPY